MQARVAAATVAAVLVGLVLTSQAGAATVYGSANVTVNMDYNLNMASMIQPYDTGWYSGPTGRFVFTYNNMNPSNMGLLPVGFCIETQTVSLGATYDYSVIAAADAPMPAGPADTAQGPMGAMKAAYLEELWGRFYNQVNSNVTGAAFALAVYEITFEDLYVTNPPGWTMASGKFQARNDGGDIGLAIAQADSWLSQIDGTGSRATLRGLNNGSSQDFLVPAPEPATMALLTLGGLAMLRRRNRIS